MTASFHASTRTRRSVLAVAAVAKGGAWMLAETLEDVPTAIPVRHALNIRRMAQFQGR